MKEEKAALNKTMCRLKDDMFFEKEFAKDVKKMNRSKLNQSIDIDGKMKKYPKSKAGLIDSYIDDEVSISELLCKYDALNLKGKKK